MPPIPLQNSNFQLDASGVAGFFGGEEAISAMTTIHVYENRKWLGWYNSPGSYTVAKMYGRLAKARLWQGLFPGGCASPANLFEFDGSSGPEYIATLSGTNITDTGHIGHLFLEECDAMGQVTEVPGRETTPSLVTVVKLETVPALKHHPTLRRPGYVLLAFFPILASVCACVLCALTGDWYLFSMVLLGIVSNGIACLVIGSGELIFKHPKPAMNCPKANGILKSEKNTVVLFGEEGAVNTITRGRFSLEFEHDPGFRNIGLCSLLLYLQLLAQLLVVPQGTLFGQTMFLMTFIASWFYNSYLSSLDRVEIQRKMLKKIMGDQVNIRKYQLPNRTAMVVFVMLALQPGDLQKVLDSLLPNATNTWMIWRKAVLDKIERNVPLEFDDNDYIGVDAGEKKLLETLLGDAKAAYQGYVDHLQKR